MGPGLWCWVEVFSLSSNTGLGWGIERGKGLGGLQTGVVFSYTRLFFKIYPFNHSLADRVRVTWCELKVEALLEPEDNICLRCEVGFSNNLLTGLGFVLSRLKDAASSWRFNIGAEVVYLYAGKNALLSWSVGGHRNTSPTCLLRDRVRIRCSHESRYPLTIKFSSADIFELFFFSHRMQGQRPCTCH